MATEGNVELADVSLNATETMLEVDWERRGEELSDWPVDELIVEVIRLLIEVTPKLFEAVVPLLDMVTVVVDDRLTRALGDKLVVTSEVRPADDDDDNSDVLGSDEIDGSVPSRVVEYAELSVEGVFVVEVTGAVASILEVYTSEIA